MAQQEDYGKITYPCGCVWEVFYREDDDKCEYRFTDGVPAELCEEHFNKIKFSYYKINGIDWKK